MSYRKRRDDVRQEEDRVPRGTVLFAGFLTVLLSVLLAAWAVRLTRSTERALRPSGQFPEAELGPRREVEAMMQEVYGDYGVGLALNERQRALLRTYRWIDRDAGLVGLPIDEAMTRVLEESRP